MAYNWDYLDKGAYNNRVGHYKFRRQFKFITEHGESHFGSILDIAGGSGRFALPLRAYSNDITVIDINIAALELLRERGKGEVEIIHGDFIDINIENKYSLILCIEAIGYFPDWEVFFDKVNNHLVSDGKFIFLYTNPDSWRSFLRKVKHLRNGFHLYNEMDLRELKALLYKCNFEIENIEGMNWIPFSLTSNNIFILFFEFIEKVFKLKYWFAQSPWLLISVRKRV